MSALIPTIQRVAVLAAVAGLLSAASAFKLSAAPQSGRTSQPAGTAAQAGRASQPVRTTTQAGRSAAPATDKLPELVYVCPMPQDADATSDKPGNCVKCNMVLQPVRLTEAWSCLSNTAFLQKQPGKCRTDGSDLVRVTARLYFSCAATPDVKEANPGRCVDGKAREEKLEVYQHGDHNPKHGGVLYMAGDGWHHIEGTYPSAGLVRAYFYDEFTRPMAVRGFSARAVITDVTGKELTSVTLKPGRITNTLEGNIPGAKAPLSVQLRVAFKPGEKETPFDFPFPDYTKEPAASVVTKNGASAPVTTAPKPATAVSAGTPAATPVAAAKPSSGATTPPTAIASETPQGSPLPQPGNQYEAMFDKMIEIAPMPDTARGIVAELERSSAEVKELLDQGQLPLIWVPALRTKDAAVALEAHVNELREPQRPLASAAVNTVVRTAWELDDLGDGGDKDKILGVHALFAAAVKELATIYDSVR